MTNCRKTTPNPREEAVRLEMESVRRAIEVGDEEAAWDLLFNVLSRLSTGSRTPASDALIAHTTLQLSDLAFAMGRGFGDLSIFLQKALAASQRVGDKRSAALIKLHLGRLYYFGERRHDAVAVFEEAGKEIEALGDRDIMTRSAEFLGLHYFIRGLFADAIDYFEVAVQAFESDKSRVKVNPSAPIWLGYCAAYTGEFHRAIGILDYYRRLCFENGDRPLAATIRSVLGIVLLLAKKKRQAAYHLSGCLQESLTTNCALALYFTRGGLAYHHCLEGRLAEAGRILGETIAEGVTAGLIRQYASPMVLEMLFEIHRAGLPPIPGLGFHREVFRVLNEPNIHLQGVGLRLRAMERADRGEDSAVLLRDLEASEECLTKAGTPVQLAKTWVEMARVNLARGKRPASREFAQKAWMTLSGYEEDFYPDDLRHLVEIGNQIRSTAESSKDVTSGLTEIIEELVPSADLNNLLLRTVAATNRFFGAERGGIFWFSRHGGDSEPALRAARNLTVGDVASESFRPMLGIIRKVYHENRPYIRSLENSSLIPSGPKAVLCLPFEVENQTRGVLYHDNSYLDGCFDFLDTDKLVKLARYLSAYIGQIHRVCLRLEQRASERTFASEGTQASELMYRSEKMRNVISRTDRVAASPTTVLILGETGVGKELLATRIHRMSAGKDNALVVVDPTAITESLVESELFGHEKGAFTGAERQKKGRLELAHEGTLFIDEVGEIPKSVQVKLLRVLQEKMLMRVGGTQTVRCDFRLITATNRDLAEEVAAGRFREDLYYRLNVVPITLPPLRERIEDIPLLADHFVKRYVAKYNRPELVFTEQDVVRLQDYDWPGNVRELQNVIERAVILSTGGRLELDIPTKERSRFGHPFEDLPTLDEVQMRYIRYVLEKTGGRIGGPGGAAQILGMKRTSLNSRLKKLGMK